ncbi:MAG: extracellular solute-binding protein [Paenibacillaceae bacterium]|nr:extracellular solute-binding protein [Paenibacillaceae bacterium]
MKVTIGIVGILVLLAVVSTACRMGGGPEQAPDEARGRLKLYMIAGDEFERAIAAPLRAKFPHIEVERTGFHVPDQGIGLTGTGNAGQHYLVPDYGLSTVSLDEPDLFIVKLGSLPWLERLGYALDLKNYIGHFGNMKQDRFDPALTELIRASGNGKTIALPYARSVTALFYNKPLFDMMQIPYPHDNMTWDEVADLALKFRGTVNGAPLYGIKLDVGLMLSQLSVTWSDAETDKYAGQADNIRTVVELARRMEKATDPSGPASLDEMIAMHANRDFLVRNRGSFDFDMVAFPSFRQAPGIGPAPQGLAIVVNPHSRQINAALRIADYLVSDEFQTEQAKEGFPPYIDGGTALVDPEIRQWDAGGLIRGKHVKAAAATAYPTFTAFGKFEAYVWPFGPFGEIFGFGAAAGSTSALDDDGRVKAIEQFAALQLDQYRVRANANEGGTPTAPGH